MREEGRSGTGGADESTVEPRVAVEATEGETGDAAVADVVAAPGRSQGLGGDAIVVDEWRLRLWRWSRGEDEKAEGYHRFSYRCESIQALRKIGVARKTEIRDGGRSRDHFRWTWWAPQASA